MAKIALRKYLLLFVIVVTLAGCIVPVTAVSWSWQSEIVDTHGDGYYSSIALDSSENPHIAYADHKNYDLKYAWKDSTNPWQTEIIDSKGFVGDFPSLKLSPTNDIPEISYHDETNNKLKYAEKNPSTGWWNTVLDPGSGAGEHSSLATDSSGRPHISYDITTEGLSYATWDENGWHYTLIDSDGTEGSIALDSSEKPAVSYFGSDQHLKYAKVVCTPPHPPFPGICLFMKETVDSPVFIRPETSLAFDTSGNPHISYMDEFNHRLKYASKTAGGWNISIVDTIATFGYGLSLALDNSDNPAISYQDGSVLKFAWMDKSGWHTMTVDQGGVGDFSSLVLDDAGNAHISYHDFTHGVLKYARGIRIEPIPFPGFIKPPTDPDHDGLYEDLNANGRLDFADVVLYFNQMQWISANEPIAAFDLNGNGRIDFADIVALFNEI